MKNLKIIIALALIIVAVGVATSLKGDSVLAPNNDKVKIDIYYVPVVSYFSDRADVTVQELNDVLVEEADRENISQILGEDKNLLVSSPEDLAKEIARGKVAILRWDKVTPNLKTLSYHGKLLWDKDDVPSYGLKREANVAEEEASRLAFDSGKLTKINFLGDIMLSRHVNTQMKKLGFGYPWEKVSAQIADADITFANLEVPITDRYDAPSQGMSFVAPTKNLQYLKEAGIDVVSVANNHTANFSKQAFLDNLSNLKAAGIGVCGGGLTEPEARAPFAVEKNGTKFNFMCQSAVVGSLYAVKSSPGVPFLGIEPWYRQNQNSLDDLVADIERPQSDNGVIIDSPHWGVEYKQYPNADQQKVARLMIDKGADLVIGTHPHVVQSLEYYGGRYISYSLGNFIFDQEWSTETKQGVMASAYFYGNKNMGISLVPLQIENYAQPRFVTGDVASKILKDIRENSKGF